MSLFITSLNSGSNGNCYYIGNNKEAVLIDVGISCREVEKRMMRLNLSLDKVKAVFISHEHSDHIRGLQVFSTKYKIPVYITDATLSHSRLNLQANLVNRFKRYSPVLIGDLSVIAFPKKHDASDPYSFIISGNGIKVGVLTDIGSLCENVIQYFNQCHAAFLEANYDETLLENGHYPYHLKSRIRSDKGHLSNVQALDLFVKHKSEFLSHVILSHLSKDNNCPILVKDLFTKHAKDTNVIVASRFKETDVFQIKNNLITENSIVSKSVFQTSLF